MKVTTFYDKRKKGGAKVKFSNVIKAETYGVRTQGIVSGAKQLGMKIRAVKVKMEDVFDDYTLPVMAQIKTKDGGLDVVSIEKSGNGKTVIMESEGGSIELNRSELKLMFPESVILLMPKTELRSKMF
jgi:ABC-type bacteriocin/lantibiotic exporter with double-glycine peptidase domain